MADAQYDLAVSFAGEQRNYVAQTVLACKRRGLRVFYDQDKNNDWWGGNFIRDQRSIYSSQTRFFVPFISTEYLSKPIPMDEFSAAMMTAVKQGDGYILPVLMGDVRVPPDLLHPNIGYLRTSSYTPEQLAEQLEQKVRQSQGVGTPPADLGAVVEHALQVRLPKVVPLEWSKYEELTRFFEHVARQFEQAAPQLRPQGFVCTVGRSTDRFSVRVERLGETVFSLDINKGGQMGDDKLTWGVGQNSGVSSGVNGWATPKYDSERGASLIEVTDLASFGSGRTDSAAGLTDAEFFTFFWDKMIDTLEQRRR